MKLYATLWEKFLHMFGIHAWENIHASPLAEEPYQAVCKVCGKNRWPTYLYGQYSAYVSWQKKHSTRHKTYA